MWGPSDYEMLFSLHQEAAEDYMQHDPDSRLGKTLLISTHNLHDFRLRVTWGYGEFIEDIHKMQLIYLHRGVDALFSLFWLVRHHQYTAAYGRVRFLLETYLVVREFNRDKNMAGKKWNEKKNKFKEFDQGEYKADPLTEFFDGTRRQLLGEFEARYDWFDDMMGVLSNVGAHPQGIRSMNHDSVWNGQIERDLLRFGNVFNFAIAAQYIRVFEGTKIERFTKEEIDPIFVHVMLACNVIPMFLEEDLEFLVTQ